MIRKFYDTLYFGNGGYTSSQPRMFDMYVVYFNTADFPEIYTIRKWVYNEIKKEYSPELPIFAQGKNLNSCREALPKGLFNIGRKPDDDKVIVEVWI
jgi:hypothetical protein